MTQVKFRTVLNFLLKQVQAVAVERDGALLIYPQQKLEELFEQPIDVNFKKVPLDQALQKLVDLTGFNVVLDAKRTKNNAQTLVTAELRQVSLEEAVIVLSSMVELKSVRIKQILYVTTRAHAQLLEKEEKSRLEGATEAQTSQPLRARTGLSPQESLPCLTLQ